MAKLQRDAEKELGTAIGADWSPTRILSASNKTTKSGPTWETVKPNVILWKNVLAQRGIEFTLTAYLKSDCVSPPYHSDHLRQVENIPCALAMRTAIVLSDDELYVKLREIAESCRSSDWGAGVNKLIAYLFPNEDWWKGQMSAEQPALMTCAASVPQLSGGPWDHTIGRGVPETLLVEHGDAVVPVIEDWLLKPGDPDRRKPAARVLCEWPTDAAYEALFRYHADRHVRTVLPKMFERSPERAIRVAEKLPEMQPTLERWSNEAAPNPETAQNLALPPLFTSPPWAGNESKHKAMNVEAVYPSSKVVFTPSEQQVANRLAHAVEGHRGTTKAKWNSVRKATPRRDFAPRLALWLDGDDKARKDLYLSVFREESPRDLAIGACAVLPIEDASAGNLNFRAAKPLD